MNHLASASSGLPTAKSGLLPLWRRPILLIAAALALLRAGYLAFPDLFPEEAYYWNYAKHLDYGYLDHPPMVAWLIHLGTLVFGDTELGVRVSAWLCSLAATFFTFRLTALLYDKPAAGYAALLMQALPFFFMTGFMMTPDAPLTACWAGALYFIARAFFERRAAAWLGVGVCLGLGMLSKYTIALLGPSILLFIVLDKPSRRWLRHGAPYGGALLALAVFSPVILWNANHHWASFAFQSAHRVREARRFSLHELVGSVLVALTPLGVYFAGRALFSRGLVSALAPAAPQDAERESEAARRLLFARIFVLAPLAVFVAFSLVHRVKLNWTGPLWLAAIPLVAAQLVALMSAVPARAGLRMGWQATVAVCALTYFGLLQYLSFGLPGLGNHREINLLPVGWSDLGKEIDHLKTEAERTAPGPVRVVALDRNFLASELAFYQPHPAKAAFTTIGSHLFGDPSLMYEYWFPPEAQNGNTLLLVNFVEGSFDKARIVMHCRPQGAVQKHLLKRNGKAVCAYFTQVATDYQSQNRVPTQK